MEQVGKYKRNVGKKVEGVKKITREIVGKICGSMPKDKQT